MRGTGPFVKIDLMLIDSSYGASRGADSTLVPKDVGTTVKGLLVIVSGSSIASGRTVVEICSAIDCTLVDSGGSFDFAGRMTFFF